MAHRVAGARWLTRFGTAGLAERVMVTHGAQHALAGVLRTIARPGDTLLTEPLIVLAPGGVTIGGPPTWGPWVLFPSSSHTRQRIDAALRDLGAPLRIAAESHQPDVLVQMVRLGLGWTVLPIAGPAGVTAGVTVGPALLDRRLVLARRSGSVHDPAADELAQRLRDASQLPVRPASRRRRR